MVTMRVRALIGAALALVLPAALAATADTKGYRLDAAQLFTLFFITLGPLKLLGPFAQATRSLDGGRLHRLAWVATAIASVALGAGGVVGWALMANWMIPVDVLQFAAGLIFLLIALKGVLAQYESAPAANAAPSPPGPLKIAFPMLVTPYGIAAVILLLAVSHDAGRVVETFAMLALVMVLNLLSMIFIRDIMRPSVASALQVLGAVLGVLQVALSITIMLSASRHLGLVTAAM